MALPPQFLKGAAAKPGKKAPANLVAAARNTMAAKKPAAKGNMPPWLAKK